MRVVSNRRKIEHKKETRISSKIGVKFATKFFLSLNNVGHYFSFCYLSVVFLPQKQCFEPFSFFILNGKERNLILKFTSTLDVVCQLIIYSKSKSKNDEKKFKMKIANF